MGKILSLIPKNMLAFLAIVTGTIVIILSQPPHSICDSQIEVVNGLQTRFLFKDPKSKKITQTKYEVLREECKETNDPGGCYEFFQELKVMLRDLNTLPAKCNSEIGALNEYRRALWEPMEMMIRLAWGTQPPASYSDKFHWLDVADISLFCQLKARAIANYGENSFDQFREKMMAKLPGSEALPRNQIWDLSILSENCSKYP